MTVRFVNSCIAISILICSAFVSCKERKTDKAGENMQEFIIAISDYAHGIDSDFIVIPQNGSELAFNNLERSEGFRSDFMNAIDGFGIEELFYDGEAVDDAYRLDNVRDIVGEKVVMVADMLGSSSQYQSAINKNLAEGFIFFPRYPDNHDYLSIPSNVINENENDVSTLAEAQNYLYLISTDNFSSAEEMISAIEATNYDVVLVDLFFEDEPLTASQVNRLKVKENGSSRLAVAYISIGSAENYRYYWKKTWFHHCPTWLKRRYDGYPQEFWVKFWNNTWQEIIFGNDESYTKKIIDANFDGAYLDNVEAYYFLYHRN
jgi:cysteinyl-tRNA synthetase